LVRKILFFKIIFLHGEIFEFLSFVFCERQFSCSAHNSKFVKFKHCTWKWMDGWMDGGSLEDNKWKVDCSICNHDWKNNNITCLLRLLIVIHAHGEGKGHWMFSSVVWTLHKTIDEKLPTRECHHPLAHHDGWMDGWMDVGRIVAIYYTSIGSILSNLVNIFPRHWNPKALKMNGLTYQFNPNPIQSNPIPYTFRSWI